MQLLAPLERVERLVHTEERAGHHVRSSLRAVGGANVSFPYALGVR